MVRNGQKFGHARKTLNYEYKILDGHFPVTISCPKGCFSMRIKSPKLSEKIERSGAVVTVLSGADQIVKAIPFIECWIRITRST